VALAIGVARHIELDVDLRAFGGSSLLGEGEIPNNSITNNSITNNTIPSTYVPARNTILLSLALGWAEVLGADRIVIGVNAIDYSGYPDCRPEFLSAFEYLATLATRAGVGGAVIRIWAPLQALSKAGIIRLGAELGVDYGLTHSCYAPLPDGRPCGQCDSCRFRARGFEEAGLADPLLSARP
jgi:7-cyano-7-deazaguanine synthase